MSILVTDHCCIILWICLLPLSVCLTEVMHSRFTWIFYIIVHWQSLCVIEFIWLSVYITGHSKVISSGVADWSWYWTSKLYIWTITDGSYWSVSSWPSKIYTWMSYYHWNYWMNTIIVCYHWMNIIIVRWLELFIAIIVQETRLISGEYLTLLNEQADISDGPDWWTILSGWTMFLNISSRVNISLFWTNIMLDQVIIGLLSFMIRRSLK